MYIYIVYADLLVRGPLVAQGRGQGLCPGNLSIVYYSIVQYSIVQYSTVQYSTVQYGLVQPSMVQHGLVQSSTVSYTPGVHLPSSMSYLCRVIFYTSLALCVCACMRACCVCIVCVQIYDRHLRRSANTEYSKDASAEYSTAQYSTVQYSALCTRSASVMLDEPSR